MNLIHLELHADHEEPDWAGMAVRLATTHGMTNLGDPKPGDIMAMSEDQTEIFDRGSVESMIRYLELAWEGEIENGFRKSIGGVQCLIVPDYSDEECGRQKGSRLHWTLTNLLEFIPWVLKSGGFSIS